VIFAPRSSVFEAHFQELLTQRKVKIAKGTLAQNLFRKIIVIYFQDQTLGAQTRLQKELSKNINLLEKANK
jgi:hypothetical protein